MSVSHIFVFVLGFEKRCLNCKNIFQNLEILLRGLHMSVIAESYVVYLSHFALLVIFVNSSSNAHRQCMDVTLSDRFQLININCNVHATKNLSYNGQKNVGDSAKAGVSSNFPVPEKYNNSYVIEGTEPASLRLLVRC